MAQYIREVVNATPPQTSSSQQRREIDAFIFEVLSLEGILLGHESRFPVLTETRKAEGRSGFR